MLNVILGDQIKDNEMVGAGGTCGAERKCVGSFDEETR